MVGVGDARSFLVEVVWLSLGCDNNWYICRKLSEEVNVVFHSAATIKFDEDLTKAVDLNVVAVFTIIEICKKMKNLQVILILDITP